MPKYITGLFTREQLDNAKQNRERIALEIIKTKKADQENLKQLDSFIDKEFTKKRGKRNAKIK